MKLINIFNPKCEHNFELTEIQIVDLQRKILIYGVEFDDTKTINTYKCKICNLIKQETLEEK